MGYSLLVRLSFLFGLFRPCSRSIMRAARSLVRVVRT